MAGLRIRLDFDRWREPIIMKYTIDQKTGCWNWMRAKSPNGYGVIAFPRSQGAGSICAHRFFYIQKNGPIQKGMELDHLCRNKGCVNPDHLEPVTRIENLRRAREARDCLNVCKRGHPLDGVRTRIGGGRYCKTCIKNNKQRYRDALKEVACRKGSV